jgi:hypothetical protein
VRLTGKQPYGLPSMTANQNMMVTYGLHVPVNMMP